MARWLLAVLALSAGPAHAAMAPGCRPPARVVAPGAVVVDPGSLLPIGATLFFAGNDGSQGSELWRSDGTTAGTVLLKDIAPGAASSAPSQLVRVGGDALLRRG